MSTAGNEHEAIVEESAVVDYCGDRRKPLSAILPTG